MFPIICLLLLSQGNAEKDTLIFTDAGYGIEDPVAISNIRDGKDRYKIYYLPLKSYWGGQVIYGELALKLHDGKWHYSPILNSTPLKSKAFYKLADTCFARESTEVCMHATPDSKGDLVYDIAYKYVYATSHSVLLNKVRIDHNGNLIQYEYYNGSGNHLLVAGTAIIRQGSDKKK